MDNIYLSAAKKADGGVIVRLEAYGDTISMRKPVTLYSDGVDADEGKLRLLLDFFKASGLKEYKDTYVYTGSRKLEAQWKKYRKEGAGIPAGVWEDLLTYVRENLLLCPVFKAEGTLSKVMAAELQEYVAFAERGGKRHVRSGT